MSNPNSLYDYLQENVGSLFRRTKTDFAYWNLKEGSIIPILGVKEHQYECETCGRLVTIHKNKLLELEWGLYKEDYVKDFLKVFEKV
jgi:hypothetical protein